jgi:hypothetical protein
MFRRFLLAAGLFAFAIGTPTLSYASPATHATISVVADSLPPLFSNEDAAQAHCPRDVVVWLNIPSGIYHYKGQRWYGRAQLAWSTYAPPPVVKPNRSRLRRRRPMATVNNEQLLERIIAAGTAALMHNVNDLLELIDVSELGVDPSGAITGPGEKLAALKGASRFARITGRDCLGR